MPAVQSAAELHALLPSILDKAIRGHRPLIDNQAAYIDGWIKTIKGDKKLIIGAAAAGQKAADWIRGERGG